MTCNLRISTAGDPVTPERKTRASASILEGQPVEAQCLRELIRDAKASSEPDAGQMVRVAGETISMRDFLVGVAAVTVEVQRPSHLCGRSRYAVRSVGILGHAFNGHSAPGDSGGARRSRLAF